MRSPARRRLSAPANPTNVHLGHAGLRQGWAGMHGSFPLRGAIRATLATLALVPGLAHAGFEEERARSLAKLSLEELMQVEVTTVLGSGQARASAPAALTVITADDIRRSGHRTLAEALRLVPGMYVGRINSSSWVIGARGLTGSAITATRYLVMVDGRVVYDPLISATFWDTTDLPLPTIDRIEVIRGPGATLWGANAMNGVVNVITKRAHDLAGTTAVVGGGDLERRYGTIVHGRRAGDAAFAVFAKYVDRGDFESPTGESIDDAWSTLRTGFRLDAPLTASTTLMAQAQAYEHPKARASVRLPIPNRHQAFEQVSQNDDVSGAHALARVEHAHGGDARTTVQAYVDGTRRDTARFAARRSTIDVDARHRRPLGERHELAFGLQYTRHSDELRSGPVLLFEPEARDWESWNAYLQGSFALGDSASLALGTKATYHDFTGFSWQPGVRFAWSPAADHTLWAAVSRPVRVPSRFEENGFLAFSYVDTGLVRGLPATGTTIPVGLGGNEDLREEELVAWELGHRTTLGDRVHVDTALFYNDYRRLIGVPPAIFGTFTDAATGTTRGFDVSATWDATERWRLEGSYSRIDVDVEGPILPFEETGTPRHLAQLRSYFDVSDTLSLTLAAYHVDEVPRIPADSYTRVDAGVLWRVRDDLELAVFGQNLVEEMHEEASGAQVPRSWYAQLTWRTSD